MLEDADADSIDKDHPPPLPHPPVGGRAPPGGAGAPPGHSPVAAEGGSGAVGRADAAADARLMSVGCSPNLVLGCVKLA